MIKCDKHVVFEAQHVVCNLPEGHTTPHQAGVISWADDQPAYSIYDGASQPFPGYPDGATTQEGVL